MIKIARLHVKKIALIAVLSIVFVAFHAGTASAYFNRDRLIDDSIFNNKNSMTAAQIDAFLNAKGSCLSTNSGFSAPDPTGYSPSGGYTYGGNVSAGTIIYHAAQAYDINPQVILTTLQKEQSLITSTSCSTNTISKAVGYGCPDSGGSYSYSGLNLYTRNGTTYTSVSGICVNSASKAGFSQQVIRAAWLLKFGQQRSLGNVGWAIIRGSWDNSDDLSSCYSGPMTQGNRKSCPNGQVVYYDGYKTIDGVAVHMDTGATAALYWYTPHFHGNQNFVALFESYFGPTIAPFYSANYHSQSSYPTLQQGQQTTITLQYKNDGNLPWYDTAAAGPTTPPVVLATSNPVNRVSEFAGSGWASVSRPATTFTAVYEADGTTLAANQHVVESGQIARYDIQVKVPKDLYVGKYKEYFMPIREGAPGFGWYMGGDTIHMVIDVLTSVGSAYQYQSPYPTLGINEQSSMHFVFKNTGTSTWYDRTNAAANGDWPVVLSTSWPMNRTSAFATSGWANTFRPTSFTAVYEADGTTLAANQHTVAPGQIAKFEFKISAPLYQILGAQREHFVLIREGARDWPVNGSSVYQDVTVNGGHYQASYVSQSSYPTVNKGETGTMWFRMKNTGSLKWYDDASWVGGLFPVHFATSWPINRVSNFSQGWPTGSRPAKTFNKVYESDNNTLAANQHVVAPGQIAEFSFPITVPANTPSGTYNEHFQPIVEYAPGASWHMGGIVWQSVIVP
ncbi:MAG TPA: hypothetical protein VFT16_02045 [Candidatus Saccharimonadales bacterium]|nr:hypothetical protein [Candidatus Saccharimonadales bacterium]